ncbi:MAG: MFS transporter [Kineosporiaceae bacterium]
MRSRLWPLYAGGLLGPFGGAMVTTMLPELATGLHTSLATAASSLTVYLVPFAAIMLVSGTLAEHWGRARTIRWAYVVYALASVLCALAPSAATFLSARAVQGAANAFTTPLLVAAISDLVGPTRLGRSLGVFGGMQAAGQAFAPLVGGMAAALDYRWAFVAAAAAAALLGAVPPADHASAPGDDATPGLFDAARWRSLANRRLALACSVAFGLYLTTSGLNLLSALLAHDRFDLGPDRRGLVVAAFGVAGLLTGPRFGRLADRVGMRPFGVVVSLVFGAVVAATAYTPSVALLVVAVAAGGAASTAGRLTSTTLAVTSTPGNRAGATSMTLAWQFLGSALAPVSLLPLYHRSVGWGFAATACGAVLAAALLAGAPGLNRSLRRSAAR